MRTIIIDDEPNSVSLLTTLITKYCRRLQIVSTFTDPRAGLDYLRSHDVDLVFLDIQMPHMTGLELLKKFSNPQFNVIFVTAYDEYAIDAIKLAALDYLLKPIDIDSLVEAVDKFQSHHAAISGVGDTTSLKLESNQRNLLIIQLQDKTLFLDPREICYLKADSNYTVIYMHDGKEYITSKTVKHFQTQLENTHFFRSHQSYLVNITYIQEYIKIDNSVRLKNGALIPVSKNKKDELLKVLVA